MIKKYFVLAILWLLTSNATAGEFAFRTLSVYQGHQNTLLLAVTPGISYISNGLRIGLTTDEHNLDSAHILKIWNTDSVMSFGLGLQTGYQVTHTNIFKEDWDNISLLVTANIKISRVVAIVVSNNSAALEVIF